MRPAATVPTVLACFAAMAPAQAEAGAWPRGEGEAFVSLGHTVSTERGALSWGSVQARQVEVEGYTTLFAEYGLDGQVTLGLDYGRGSGGDTWSGLVFLRRSFRTKGPNVWAVEVALGASGLVGDDQATVLRPGLHWGRGTAWGWIGVESYLVHRSEKDAAAYKLDATVGWNQSDRAAWIAQVQTADYPGAEPTVRLAPSYVRRLSERMRVELGVVADVAGREDVGLQLGSWLEF